VQIRENRQTHLLVQSRTATERIARLGDFLIACVLLAITLPLIVIVVLAIKLESPGPVLDRRTCIGRGGRRFEMLKFRTAVHDPYRAARPWGLGRFLWRTRVEALPQLVNVLRGEMSMIDRAGSSPSFLD
jgi:lipopolysaccharide/colanic/teichoic acid biosynthesis glycosyltransferase